MHADAKRGLLARNGWVTMQVLYAQSTTTRRRELCSYLLIATFWYKLLRGAKLARPAFSTPTKAIRFRCLQAVAQVASRSCLRHVALRILLCLRNSITLGFVLMTYRLGVLDDMRNVCILLNIILLIELRDLRNLVRKAFNPGISIFISTHN